MESSDRFSCRRLITCQLVLFLAILTTSSQLIAHETLVAVASNFAAPAEGIARAFVRDTGYKAVISNGSSGRLFAQISQGAPFDVLLAADRIYPQKLLDVGLAVPGSNFTYAYGRIALYSKQPDLVDDKGEILKNSAGFSTLAIANPDLAPYGVAALEVLEKLGLDQSLNTKRVMGENIAQTFQFVLTGNAELGLVALSQLSDKTPGSWWIVPADLYSPIAQDAVLLRHGSDNEAAKAFIAFLKSDAAREIIKSHGYELN